MLIADHMVALAVRRNAPITAAESKANRKAPIAPVKYAMREETIISRLYFFAIVK